MLAVARQTACRAFPQCFPRYMRPFSTAIPTTGKEEALHALGLSPNQDLLADASPTPPVATPSPVDLASMHHYIPPPSSPLLQFMTTLVMNHGEYAKAAKTVSQMLLHIYALTRSPPVPVVEKAVEIASPAIRNRKMKQGGGKTVFVPQALNERQRTRRGLSWIIEEAGKKGKPGKTYAERLARQIIATVNGHEGTNKFKAETHRVAMVNRYGKSINSLSFSPDAFSQGVLYVIGSNSSTPFRKVPLVKIK